jgi:hypothetical protein
MQTGVRMRTHLSTLCFLALTLTACDQGEYCGDVFPNATVTDVFHEGGASNRLIIGLYHALSFCTGTDEKRFSNERIEVDLNTGEVSVYQKASNNRGPLDMPDVGAPLYRDGHFDSQNCAGCELLLRTSDQIYTIHFTTFQDFDPAMILEILEEDVPLAVVDIGGYTSEPRPSR